MAKTIKIDRTHERILHYLGKGENISEIKKHIKISKQAYYKRLNTLEKYKFITKKRVGKILTFELQPKAIKRLTMLSVGTQKVDYQKPYINIHDIWMAFKILNKPRNWSNEFIEKTLSANSIDYNTHNPNNWKGYFFNYAKVTIRVTPNKIMFNPPQVELNYKGEIDMAKNQIVKYVYNIIPKIERLLNVSLTKPDKLSVTVASQHIAFVNDLLAKYFYDKGIKVIIRDENNKPRVIVDRSRGTPELEFINKAYAEEDAEKLQDTIKSIITGEFNPKVMNENINKVVNNQLAFAKNLEAHIKVMKDINKSINKLNNKLDKL